MVKRKSSQTEDDDLLLNRQPTDDREEEDYDVADLSAIPAPKIEFVMPNLTPLEGAKKQPLKKKTLKASGTPSSSEETLTSEQLNIEIVHLRPIVQKAQRFLAQRLVRKMKLLEKLLEEKETDAVKRKVARFEEEIHFLKKIKKDEVSKFALLNKKTLGLLGITDKTPVKDRCIFKLACEPPMVKAIKSFRARYPSWEVTTAFLLQRLGLQYNSAKDGKWPMGSEGEESDGSRSDSEESDKESPIKVLPKSQSKKKLTKGSLSETPNKAGPIKQLKRKKVSREVRDGSEHKKEDEDDVKKSASDNDNKQMAESSSSEKSSPVKSPVLKKKKSLPLQSSAVGTKVVKKKKKKEQEKSPTSQPLSVETTVVKKKKEKKKSLPVQSSADKPTMKKKKSKMGAHSEAKSEEFSAALDEPHKLAVVKKINLNKKGEIKLDKRPAPPLHQQNLTTGNAEQDNFFMPVSASTSNNHDVKRQQDEVAVTTERKRIRLSEESRIPSFKGGVNKKSNGMAKSKSFLKKEHPHSKLLKKQETPPEELHPSWAARRLAKERQLSAPQGKRIVFDD